MIKVALVRGKHLNLFEGQNYAFPKGSGIALTGISSLRSIHKNLPFPRIALPSIADLSSSRVVKAVSNRIIGDSQVLFGLEKYSTVFDIFDSADPHYYYSYQLAKLRAQNKIKTLIFTCWETIPFNNESILRKKYIKRYALKYADYFVCRTHRAKRSLIKEGIKEGEITIIRTGVDLEKFKPSRSFLRKSHVVKLLFAGRNVPEKGLDDVIKIFPSLKKALKNHRINLELETVERESYEKMPKVYNRADIVVIPSKTTHTWEEQYGMVCVEAMASGVPLVAYKSGAISEVVGKAGILVDEGNLKRLYKAIYSLALQPTPRRKLGKMGRERARKIFDARQIAKQYQNFYETISSNSRKK